MTINRDLANLVPTITQSSANVGVSTTSPVAKLDVAYGDYQNAGAIRFGANIGTNTARTNSTRKFGALTTPHYTNTEENIVSISVDSESSYTALNIGGGSSSFNSPTYITFLTQAAINTGGGTERMRIDASGNVLIGKTSPTANGGDLQVSKGITFPATQAAQSDANTLDDYEEGNWTPTFQGAGTAGTYTLSGTEARYTKIGRMVTLYAKFGFSAASGGSAYARVDGIPFPIDTTNFGVAMFSTVDLDAACIQVCTARVSPATNSSLFFSQLRDNLVDLELPVASFTTSSTVYFTFTYFVS